MDHLIKLFPHHPNNEELLARLDELRTMVEALDAQEPEDIDSEEYELWGQTHEDLEDRIDDILDLLDEE